MSFTKRFIEYQEYNDYLLAALKYMDNKEMFPENQIRGIARSIVKKKNPENLNTKSQRWAFYQQIVPLMNSIICEDCNSKIGIENLE